MDRVEQVVQDSLRTAHDGLRALEAEVESLREQLQQMTVRAIVAEAAVLRERNVAKLSMELERELRKPSIVKGR